MCLHPPGYVSGRHYKTWGGTNWVSNVLLCTVLYCGPVLVVFSFLNTVAIFYRSTAALPFGTIVIIILIWALITFPLTVLGGIAAKNSKAEFNAPCRWVTQFNGAEAQFLLALLEHASLLDIMGA